MCPVTLLSTSQPPIHTWLYSPMRSFLYERTVSLRQNSVFSMKTELGLINRSFFLQCVWSLQDTKAHRLYLGEMRQAPCQVLKVTFSKFYNLLCLKVRGWEEKGNNKSNRLKKKKKKKEPDQHSHWSRSKLHLPLQGAGRELGLLTASKPSSPWDGLCAHAIAETLWM